MSKLLLTYMEREMLLKYLIKPKQYCDLFQFKGINLIIKEKIRTKNKTDTFAVMKVIFQLSG